MNDPRWLEHLALVLSYPWKFQPAIEESPWHVIPPGWDVSPNYRGKIIREPR